MDNEFFKTIFSAVDKNEDLILNAERYIWKWGYKLEATCI